jgi:glycosyltransferase involved in cell wall biosynthesis
MKKENKSLSIVFPAYNEEKNIEETLSDAYKFADKHFKDFEIIVVNDGSKDKTAEKVENISKKHKKVKLLNNSKNLGYGATVWKGLKAAKKELIFFSDADRQFNLKEIANIIEHVGEYDVVIGYRRKRQDSFLRKLNAWGWKLLIRLVLNLKIRDIDCAFKLFRNQVVQEIKVESTGATFSAELIYNIKKSGFKIKEIGVSHFPRVAGSPTGAKFSVIKKAFVELWSLYKKDEELVKIKSRYIYFVGAALLFASRLFLRSNSLDFFDSSEYLWRTGDSSLLKAMATGHAPFHPLYVFFSWILHHSPFGFSEVASLELTSALLGSTAIIFLFLFVKKLFNSRIAWLSAIIFALLPFVFVSQTTVLVDASEHAFYFLSLYLWLLALERKGYGGKIMSLISGLSFGLAAFSHTQVAIWGLSILVLPIVTVKQFKIKDLLDLLYKYILFAVGGAFFIYLYLELLLFSNSIGWHESTNSYASALKYLIFGNIGDHDSIEIKKVVYYVVALASSLLVLTGLLGALKMFFKEKRKLLFLILWFLPFIIGSTYIYENLYARTLIIGLAPIAVLSSYWLIDLKRFRSLSIFIVILQLMILSFPVIYRYKTAPAPIENIKSFVSDLKPNGIFISSNLTKTLANAAYKGEFVNFGDVGYGAGYVEGKVNQALQEDKPAYVLSDALILPYRRYDGEYYDLRSVGTGNAQSHGSNLENLFRQYNITLSKVEDYSFKRSVYQIDSSQESDYLEVIKRESQKTPIIFGRLVSSGEPVSGAIINNYNKNFCGTVKENITRLDLGLCIVRSFREEPENWTFTDKDGWYYLPSDKPETKMVIGTNPGQTRVKSLKGEFAEDKAITPSFIFMKEFSKIGDLQNAINNIDKSFYVVTDGKIFKLYTYKFDLPRTNVIEAKDISAEAGKLVQDKIASKQVKVSDERSGYMISGPYIDLEEGNYKVIFNVRRDKAPRGDIVFEVAADYGRINLGKIEKSTSDLPEDRFEEIEIPFEVKEKVSGVEFRVKTDSFSGVRVESIQINK